MNFQVIDNIVDLKNNWSKLELPLFLRRDFLSGWGACNPSVKPLFFFNKSCFLYAQIFTLKLFKTLNYSYKFSIISHVFRLFQLQVLYFGNCYMTNFPFFISKQKYDIKQITDDVNLDWSALIVPDFFINNLTHTKKYKALCFHDGVKMHPRGRFVYFFCETLISCNTAMVFVDF